MTDKTSPIRYEIFGDGPPLILLHGYLESLDIWKEFIPGMTKDFRVIAIDLPGHGHSKLLAPVASMELMADAIVEVMETLQIEKACVVGHSMGGYAALAMLENHPNRVQGLCLFHSHARSDSPEVVEKRKREIRIVEAGQKHLLVQQNIPNMFAPQNLEAFEREVKITRMIARQTRSEGVIGAIRGLMQRPDRSTILKNASVPCLQIIGKHDLYIPFEEVSLKTELPDGSERLILEHSGHMGFFEEKAKTVYGIREFVKRIN